MIFALLDHSPKLYIHIYVYIYRYTQICPWSLQNYCAGHLVWKDSTQWSCIHGLLYYSQLSRQQDHGWLIIIGYTPGSIEIVNQATIWLPIHQPICYCTGCIDHWLVDVLFFTPLFQVIFKIPKNGKNNPRIFDGIWIDILQIVVTYNAIEATKEWTIYHHADLKTGEYIFFLWFGWFFLSHAELVTWSTPSEALIFQTGRVNLKVTGRSLWTSEPRVDPFPIGIQWWCNGISIMGI